MVGCGRNNRFRSEPAAGGRRTWYCGGTGGRIIPTRSGAPAVLCPECVVDRLADGAGGNFELGHPRDLKPCGTKVSQGGNVGLDLRLAETVIGASQVTFAPTGFGSRGCPKPFLAGSCSKLGASIRRPCLQVTPSRLLSPAQWAGIGSVPARYVGGCNAAYERPPRPRHAARRKPARVPATRMMPHTV